MKATAEITPAAREIASDDAQEQACAHLSRGTALIKSGQLTDAEGELRAAVELDPTCAGAWVNLGGILLAKWQFQESVEANRRAVEAQPDLGLAHFNQGLGLLCLGKAKAAVDCLSRAIALDPKNGAAFFHLAPALEELGRTDEAQLCIAYAAELGYSPKPAEQEPLALILARKKKSTFARPSTHAEEENRNGAAQSR